MFDIVKIDDLCEMEHIKKYHGVMYYHGDYKLAGNNSCYRRIMILNTEKRALYSFPARERS